MHLIQLALFGLVVVFGMFILWLSYRRALRARARQRLAQRRANRAQSRHDKIDSLQRAVRLAPYHDRDLDRLIEAVDHAMLSHPELKVLHALAQGQPRLRAALRQRMAALEGEGP